MEQPGVSVVAIAWYRPEEWDDIKRLCPDLDDTYQEWLASAETTIEDLGKSSDLKIVKAVLSVGELRRWKRATGREVTARIRSQLAAKAARKQDESP